MATILDGRKLNEEIASALKSKISQLEKPLALAIIQVGGLSVSNRYIKYKKAFADKIGAQVLHIEFPQYVTEEILIKKIKELNTDSNIDGVIVQLPLPESLNKEKIIESIDPKKDVDGQTPANTKALEENKKGIVPATTRGILMLLDKYKINAKNKKVVVIGRSKLVGIPTAQAFKNLGAQVEVCHSQTPNTSDISRGADILISATGVKGLVTEDFINPNQVIVDVGINISEEGKLSGDVDFEKVKDKVSYITPVPGGVGPMTICGLFMNLFETRD